MILSDFLSKPYSLAMAPGFFRIYAHTGILHALEEAGLLNVCSAAGSSAGAMAAGFLCAGLSPGQMIDKILEIKRPDIWDADPGFRLGLLKGELLQDIFERSTPAQDFESCPIPCGMTAFDVLGAKTVVLKEGSIATNMRASACFPIICGQIRPQEAQKTPESAFPIFFVNLLHPVAETKSSHGGAKKTDRF